MFARGIFLACFSWTALILPNFSSKTSILSEILLSALPELSVGVRTFFCEQSFSKLFSSQLHWAILRAHKCSKEIWCSFFLLEFCGWLSRPFMARCGWWWWRLRSIIANMAQLSVSINHFPIYNFHGIRNCIHFQKNTQRALDLSIFCKEAWPVSSLGNFAKLFSCPFFRKHPHQSTCFVEVLLGNYLINSSCSNHSWSTIRIKKA